MFYTRGILRSIKISWLAKTPTLYLNWMRFLNEKKGYLFELHRIDGEFKDIHCIAQNAALFVDLL